MVRSCTCLLLEFCSESLTCARNRTHIRRHRAQTPHARAKHVQATICPATQSLEPTEMPQLALQGFYSANLSSTTWTSATQSSLSNISDSNTSGLKTQVTQTLLKQFLKVLQHCHVLEKGAIFD